MKKLTSTLLAAGLLVTASACATTKLTTAETCDRVNLVVSSPSGSLGKSGMIRVANAIRPIEAVASDELKPVLQAIVNYADESVKENPDSAKLANLKTKYESAGAEYGRLCRAS